MIIETPSHPQITPAAALLGKRHAARLPGDGGAGAAEAAENQEAEK